MEKKRVLFSPALECAGQFAASLLTVSGRLSIKMLVLCINFISNIFDSDFTLFISGLKNNSHFT